MRAFLGYQTREMMEISAILGNDRGLKSLIDGKSVDRQEALTNECEDADR
jgi:hypothetical protein